MNRWKAGIILFLLLAPLAAATGMGIWALWNSGWFLWIWLVLPLSWFSALLLARWWRSPLLPLSVPQPATPLHWTDKDAEAWKVIDAVVQAAREQPPERFIELQFYVDTAKKLSLDVTRCYHPNSDDPIGSLTIGEILSAGQLALADLEDLVRTYVPASHLVTIKRWKSFQHAPKWYQRFRAVYWAMSALFAPHTLLGRYAVSKTILGPLADEMLGNVLVWFYISFVQRVGAYVIEMNSGRLRGGTQAFREKFGRPERRSTRPGAPAADSGKPSRQPGRTDATETHPLPQPSSDTAQADVTMVIMGQVNAGKSSLVNALVQDSVTKSDVLPTTDAVTRHVLSTSETGERVIILDTPGYGQSGTSAAQKRALQTAGQGADVILLVMNVTSPARHADAQVLRELSDWLHEQPHLKHPMIIAVLTHIDLLSPRMEWSPPYNWQHPTTPKERQIHDAVAYNTDVLGPWVDAVVPLCTDLDGGRLYGLDDWLLPVMASTLKEARACSLVRALHSQFDDRKLKQVVQQLLQVGTTLLRAGLLGGHGQSNERS